MNVEVELFDDLDAVARDADGALDRGATASLFERLDWYRLTLAHCPPPGRLLVARAAQGTARAWLFLMLDRRRASALASWYTLAFAPVEQDGAGGLLRAIAVALRRRGIATVALAPMRNPEPVGHAFTAAGWHVRVAAAAANWQVRTAGESFALYWARRPVRLRETARRKSARAQLNIRILNHFDADIWSDYERVYAGSWKPGEGSPAFLRELAQIEGAAGTLRLGVAYKDGEAIAAQFWLVENGTATIHKLAHVERARHLSPGTLLSRAMFEHVIDRDRPDTIDFGTGDDAYKADWMDQRRMLFRLEAFNLRAPAGLIAAARAAASSLVRRLRRD